MLTEVDVPSRRSRISFEAIGRLADLADFTAAFALRAVCKLGVADHLDHGPRPVEELAAATGTNPDALLRTMRALVARGVFLEPSPRYFELTPISELLRSDHPLSMRDAFRLHPDVEALSELDYSVRTGEASFTRLYREGYWDYVAARPDLNAAFRASQRALSRLEAIYLLRVYDWSAFRSVVDVGGNDGAFLRLLLSRHPTMRGTLFDLPETVAVAPGMLTEEGLTDRCAVVPGNFFDAPLPSGADAYVIKRVLCSFDDEGAATVARRIRNAMRPDSRLLVLEPMNTKGDYVGGALDMLMLVLATGRVRTPEEFEKVLTMAEMTVTRVAPAGLVTLIEARVA
jgi:hypothetical protein